MFAKQIAVMKGQAWNVVETLKTPDHGPLELTRRAKVCVWDDLVDVPVAVPMRMTSSELRRTSYDRQGSLDEADIASSAPTANVPVEDLLGFASPPADMPHPGRFDIATPSGEDAHSPGEAPVNGSSIPGPAGQHKNGGQSDRPSALPSGYRASFQGPARSLNAYDPDRQQRRYSFATAAARRNSNSTPQLFYDDDLEGDLGYAAAEGQMGNQRKVIVERLEPVKSKNPVFTWC